MADKNFLTESGHKRLKEELNKLKKIDRVKIAEKIKEARDMGDVQENTYYDSTLEEQGYIEGRIEEIEIILSNSAIVDKSKADKSSVSIGNTVVVELEKKKDQFTIVGSVEADPIKKMISNESPVGKALLGAKVGDHVEVKTPIFTATYKILEIK